MIKYNRLLKLAKHLESGKLGHKKFDFSMVSGGAKKPYTCGTSGCALGECPIVFPRDWKFGLLDVTGWMDETFVSLKDTKYDSGDFVNDIAIKDAKKFFGLTHKQALHLFYPSSQNPSLYGGDYIDETATRKQVASNIREFVKVMRKRANRKKVK